MATETDKVNTGALATLVAVGAFAMVAICLALVALVRDELSQEQAAKDATADAAYRSLTKAQLQKLEAGTSIEKAMATVVGEYSANPALATPPGAAVPAPGHGGAGGAAATGASGASGGAGSQAGGATGASGATGTQAGGATGATTTGALPAPGDGSESQAAKPAGSAAGKAPTGKGHLAAEPDHSKDAKLPPGGGASAPNAPGGVGSENEH